MNDPETKRFVYIGGAILLGLAVVNQIYEAGVNAGLRAANPGMGGYDGDGFVPFPLLILGFIGFLVYRRRAKRNGAGGLGSGRGHGHGPGFGHGGGFGGGRPPRLFEEWHRRAHEAAPVTPVNGSAPATPPAPAAPAPPSPEGTPVGTTLV
ncbi:MAG: hypothetical protein AVDCRST_MAG19-4143 [uncultured Thermomicrobiales bacterium]|uniref:Uncharacterized protein n=1 Tax=uncultured Thermomicrobiales bacterium TaxID=1645740 RepID=A0A6J4VM68_9BACT|nr:MAG: hypothetical protein AVDCRST_MAG19-4143 [uncultured Thermomicrobiales bacterium]